MTYMNRCDTGENDAANFSVDKRNKAGTDHKAEKPKYY